MGNIASRWTEAESGLGLTDFQGGAAASIYLAGAVIGAIGFSYLTDKYGRRKLFLITLAVYLVASFLTAFSPNFWVLAIFRFFAGAGIGGEYSAIYSAVDELIPARYRGQVALAISGSYWVGAMGGSALSIVLLNENVVDQYYGWRIAFLFGGILSLAVLLIRRFIPESPRWLAIHGRNDEAEEITENIEEQVRGSTGRELPLVEERPVHIEQRDATGFGPVLHSMFRLYPRRTFLGLTLMASQAFLYNAILFTYGVILGEFYGIDASSVGYYIFPFAIGNFVGLLLLGRLFDTLGRVPMISGCYLISGTLLAFTGYLFLQGTLTAVTQTLLWCIFFFASAAASAAYLTVSEVFPMEVRALAIALFYGIGTGVGGVAAPAIFGALTATGDRASLFIAYLIGAGFMIFAARVELFLGVRAEGKPLESVARPLTAVEGPPEAAAKDVT